MAYTINRTDGSIEATVPDGTIYSDRSLVLIGRNFNGYGEFIAENFIRLLESHALDSQPGNPMTGQTWFDTDASILRVYDGTTFKNIGTAPSQTTEPLTPVGGDIWYDTSVNQLKVYNSVTASYTLVGPLYSTATGIAGPIVTIIKGIDNQDRIVTLMYSNNNVIAILSENPTFIPLNAIPGFNDVNPGMQLADNYSGFFTGTATNSNSLGGEPSANYLRTNVDGSITGTLSVTSLIVGDGSLNDTAGDVVINNGGVGDVIIASQGVAVITIDGVNNAARVAAPGSNDLDITNKKYVNDEDLKKVNHDGSNSITGIIKPSGNATIDFGSSALRFKTMYAQEVNAGTTVTVGNNATITDIALTDSMQVAGVTNSTKGYIKFGTAGAKVGCNGTTKLTVQGVNVVTETAYAASTVAGAIKARLSGTTLYLSNTGLAA